MLTLIHNNTEHGRVSELLPWYVNRTLGQAEHETVENHVSMCEICQQEIKFLQATFEAANDFDAAVIPCDERFNAIMQRIERTGGAQSSPGKQHAANLPGSIAWYQKPQMAIAASFLGAMLILYWVSPLFLGEYMGNNPGKSADYQVLTSADTAAIELQVNFERNTGKDEAQRILTAADPRFTVNDSHPNYTFKLPGDYDVIKISELIKTLNSKNQIATVKIVREDN